MVLYVHREERWQAAEKRLSNLTNPNLPRSSRRNLIQSNWETKRDTGKGRQVRVSTIDERDRREERDGTGQSYSQEFTPADSIAGFPRKFN